METKLYAFLILLLMMLFPACGAGNSESQQKQPAPSQRAGVKFAAGKPALSPAGSSTFVSDFSPGTTNDSQKEIDIDSFLQTIDQLAEIERSGAWFQGMALRESGIRENAGDYAGAVAAAYKELSWAYGLGLLQKADVERGLLSVLTLKSDEIVITAASAILAFEKGRWDEAAEGLSLLKKRVRQNEQTSFFDLANEPDSFDKWMTLVCSLEKSKSVTNKNDVLKSVSRNDAAAYGSIRARYAPFPEYWYRGARAFSGAIAADYAENCINLAPNGPFAEECRKIIASFTGLKTDDGLSIKTKKEIGAIVNQSVNSGNPQLLNSLLPLIGLPDNPYTVYAVDSLRSLTNIPGFRDYFKQQTAAASGRLAERLSYICRS